MMVGEELVAVSEAEPDDDLGGGAHHAGCARVGGTTELHEK